MNTKLVLALTLAILSLALVESFRLIPARTAVLGDTSKPIAALLPTTAPSCNTQPIISVSSNTCTPNTPTVSPGTHYESAVVTCPDNYQEKIYVCGSLSYFNTQAREICRDHSSCPVPTTAISKSIPCQEIARLQQTYCNNSVSSPIPTRKPTLTPSRYPTPTYTVKPSLIPTARQVNLYR